jgi:hypothetical protein
VVTSSTDGPAVLLSSSLMFLLYVLNDLLILKTTKSLVLETESTPLTVRATIELYHEPFHSISQGHKFPKVPPSSLLSKQTFLEVVLRVQPIVAILTELLKLC